jgi:hypothetical protein
MNPQAKIILRNLSRKPVYTIISLVTINWHSWRAATRNPVEVLRYE